MRRAFRTTRWSVVGIALILGAVACRAAAPSSKTPLEAALEAVTAPAEAEAPILPPGVTLPDTGLPGASPEAIGVPPQDLSQVAGGARLEPRPLAFAFLPQTNQGYVGVIRPVDSLNPKAKTLEPMNFNIIFPVKGDLPDVVYPHYGHTLWLDCKNCHPGIFVMQAGVNPVTMDAIAKGEYCGRCHGTVAFSLSDCNRCHSRPKPGKEFIIPRAPG
jgi:c(7)-type cytochrome triheme protein